MSKKIALIGYGYWGPNLLRNFFETPDCEVLYCCDKDLSRLKEVRKRFPSVIPTTNSEEILKDTDLSAVIIATPTKYHYELAKQALKANKDVLIEKPMTLTADQAAELVALAAKKKLILMVDHTFLYNPAVIKIKEIIDSGELGQILYLDCVRANLGLFQKDSNVIFDLATHDFSIIHYLLGTKPTAIQGFGKSHFNKQEDVCFLIAHYPNDIFAHIHVNWLSPLKVRTITIVGTKKMLVYDDLQPAEKIRVYEKGVTVTTDSIKEITEQKISYRNGDVWLPNIKNTEALSNMAKDFISSITNRTQPLSNAELGAAVVALLEKSTESVRSGKLMKL